MKLGLIGAVASDYRIAQPLIVRLLGALVAGLGGFVLLLALVVGSLTLPSAVLGTGMVLAVVTLLAGGVLLLRGAVVVHLDDVGYRVRFVRGAGVTQARWTDVEDAVAATVAGERCLVLRLRDGRTTTIPMRMLAGSADDFARDLQVHLDRGHGYRRLT